MKGERFYEWSLENGTAKLYLPRDISPEELEDLAAWFNLTIHALSRRSSAVPEETKESRKVGGFEHGV